MNLYSLQKKLLYISDQPTLKRTLEEAVENGALLKNLNLRRARLRGARLDGLKAPGACLWGADLSGCDLAEADLRGADCRMATWKDACLADATCRQASFMGAYFKDTLVEGADFSFCAFSCPSILTQPLHACRSLEGARYWHRGEYPCDLANGIASWHVGAHAIVALGPHLIVNGRLLAAGSADPRSRENENFPAR